MSKERSSKSGTAAEKQVSVALKQCRQAISKLDPKQKARVAVLLGMLEGGAHVRGSIEVMP